VAEDEPLTPCKNPPCSPSSSKKSIAHDFTNVVDEPPSIAAGGKGVVVTGCPTCKKRFQTTSQFIDHLTDDVLPPLLDGLSSER
jgi:hypothetical protein